MQFNNKKDEQLVWGQAIALFGRFTAWILAPAFIGATLGLWLDKKFNTEPWIFLFTTMISFVVAMMEITRNALGEYKKMNKVLKKSNNKHNGRDSK